MVRTHDADFSYDFLILASGGRTSYFGHDEWRKHAPGLKDLSDAVEIRNRVLLAFEEAEKDCNPQRKQQLLTFVVVGGGPTGVEIAGSIAELARFVLSRDFRSIAPQGAEILLLEGGPSILPAFDPGLAESAVKQLNELGVSVRVNAQVTDINENGVRLGDEFIRASTIIWAAGVRATSLTESLGSIARQGRAGKSGADLTIPGHRDAFAVGDMVTFSYQTGKPLPV